MSVTEPLDRQLTLVYKVNWVSKVTLTFTIMDYEHKAKAVADCLLGYKRDESGWKVCKKSVNICCYYCLIYMIHPLALIHAVLWNNAREPTGTFINVSLHVALPGFL